MARAPRTPAQPGDQPVQLPKAAPGTVPETKEHGGEVLRAELTIEPPSSDDIQELAIQLALVHGERRPLSYLGGRPIWQRFEERATDLLVLAAWKESK